MINLTHVINIVTKELMGTIKAVSRVRDALGDNANPNATGVTGAKKPAATATAASTAGAADAAKEGHPVVEGEGGADAPAAAGQAAGEGGGGEGDAVVAAGAASAGGDMLPVAQVSNSYRVSDDGVWLVDVCAC